MKGLLLKDFYQINKYCRFYFLIVVVFAGVSIFANNSFFLFYPLLLTGIMPLTLQAYDEGSKWTSYSGALPYSRAQLVAAKYLIGLFVLCITAVLIVISQSVRMVREGAFRPEELLQMVAFMVAMSIVSPSIIMPIVFRFGTEKARLIFLGFVVVISITLTSLVKRDMLVTTGNSFSVSNTGGMLCLAAGALAVYALSCLLSIALYKKREL